VLRVRRHHRASDAAGGPTASLRAASPRAAPAVPAARPQPPVLSVGRLAPAARASRWRRAQRAVEKAV
jgi:hypothetical protein